MCLLRVQRSSTYQPALRASSSKDVLAQRSFLLARKFLCFTVLLLINFKEKFSRNLLLARRASER